MSNTVLDKILSEVTVNNPPNWALNQSVDGSYFNLQGTWPQDKDARDQITELKEFLKKEDTLFTLFAKAPYVEGQTYEELKADYDILVGPTFCSRSRCKTSVALYTIGDELPDIKYQNMLSEGEIQYFIWSPLQIDKGEYVIRKKFQAYYDNQSRKMALVIEVMGDKATVSLFKDERRQKQKGEAIPEQQQIVDIISKTPRGVLEEVNYIIDQMI
jgi:hypothetical protein